MPIHAENKRRYPRNWKQIRAEILKRADNHCEQCGVPNHAWRNEVTGEWAHNAGVIEAWHMDGDQITRIALTIAHLDHRPDHNDPTNLKALCKRCHLAYDEVQHQQAAYQTRRAEKAIGDLFDHA